MNSESQNHDIRTLTNQLHQIVEKVQSLENVRDKQEQELSVLRHEHDQTHGIAYFADLAGQVKQCTEKVQQLEVARDRQEQKLRAMQEELKTIKSKKPNEEPSDVVHNVVVEAAKPPHEVTPPPKPPDVHWDGLTKRIECLTAKAIHLRPIQASVWEVPLILFSEPLTAIGSIITSFILFLNIVMQVVAVIIAEEHMTKDHYGTETQAKLEAWRLTVAHDYMYMNRFEMTSLAARVCSADPTLIYAKGQTDMVNEISTYVPKEGLKAIISGEALCVMALLTWWAKLGREFVSAVEYIVAVYNLPKSKTALVETDKGFRFESIHVGRLVFTMVISFIRLAICFCLFFVGSKYIVHTTSLKDLLLKALALQVILNLDELLYATFAPLQAKTMISVIAPLSKPSRMVTSSSSIPAMNIKALSRILLYVVSMAILYILIIAPHTDDMRSTYQILCGGDVNFVTQQDVYGFTYAAPTRGGKTNEQGKRYIEMKANAAQNIKKATRVAAAGMGEAALDQFLLWDWSIMGFEALKGRSSEDQYLEHQPFCKDRIINPTASKDRIEQVYMNNLKAVFTNPTFNGKYTAFAGDDFHSCRDLVQLCWDAHVGGRVRWLCPETCACDSAFTGFPIVYWGQPMEGTSGGCAPSCDKPYQEQLADVSCVQLSPDELSVNAAWNTWSENVLSFTSQVQGPGVTDRIPLLMLELGCGIVENESEASGIDLCEDPNHQNVIGNMSGSGSVHRAFFRLMCPVACRCKSHFRRFCPDSCSGDR